MYKWWPSPLLFVAAAFLFFQGCTLQDNGKKYLAEHPQERGVLGIQFDPPGSDRSLAKSNVETGFAMQIGGGVLAAIGVVLFGLGLLHRQVQTQALSHRLAVAYDFVAAVPAEGVAPDPALLTEDQAVDQLQARYPTLAHAAVEKLRREFAEKRRLEPMKIWYVKGLQVNEVKE